jgi:hypothetical protein
MIVTVTLNAAIDRTLVVPNFQPGHRHRASAGFQSAGGKGINVARALKRLGAPVVCTGLAGGRTGTRLVEELTNEGILNDFVRIREESRTSITVLDPTTNAYTEVNEWGPEVSEDELEMLREKLDYLAQRAEFVVLAGSLPRGVDPGVYGELVRDLARRQLLAVLDTEGEPLRLGVEGTSSTMRTSPPRWTRSPRWARGTSSSRSTRGATRCSGRTETRCACAPAHPTLSRRRPSGRGTRSSPGSSPRASAGAPSTTPSGAQSRQGPPPCSSRAPDASTRARRAA